MSGSTAVQPGVTLLLNGDPTGDVTPNYAGQIAFDQATGNAYVATGVTSADWRQTAAGGGSLPVNWVKLALVQRVLTVASPTNAWAGGLDLTIVSQAGTDFYFDVDNKLHTVSGGRFQCGGYLSYDTPTIDGGSTVQRFLAYKAQLGESSISPPVFGAGMDILVPVFDPAALNADQGVQTVASAIGYANPGGVALDNISCVLIQASGTDSVPTYTDPFLVWQV